MNCNIAHVMPLKKNDWYIREQKPELRVDCRESDEWKDLEKTVAKAGAEKDVALGAKVEVVAAPAVGEQIDSNNYLNAVRTNIDSNRSLSAGSGSSEEESGDSSSSGSEEDET